MTNLRELAAIGAAVLLSLGLVLVVGFGEADKTRTAFQVERLAAHGAVLAGALDGHVRAGLPIEAFGGFPSLARPVVEADDTLVEAVLLDARGRPVAAFAESDAPTDWRRDPTRWLPAEGQRAELTTGDGVAVGLALRSGTFGTSGFLVLSASRAQIEAPVRLAFIGLLPLFGGLLAIGTLAIVALGRRWPHRRLSGGAQILLFCGAATAVVITLVGLYRPAVTGHTEALTDALARRLEAPGQLGLPLSTLSDIDGVFRGYRTTNPDIEEIALTVDGTVRLHDDPARVGGPWQRPTGSYVFEKALAHGEGTLHVAVPRAVLVRAVGRSVRNFAGLLLAALLLMPLFFGATRALTERAEDARPAERVRVFFTVAMLVEGLCVPFLPLYFEGVLGAGAESLTASLFTVYFAAYATSLLAGARLSRRMGPTGLMGWGMLLAAIGLVLCGMADDYAWLAAGRVSTGIGQGLASVGVQGALLGARSAGSGKAARGASSFVFAYYSGLLSGTALGGLLVHYTRAEWVLGLAAGLAGCNLLFCLLRLRSGDGPQPARERSPLLATLRDRGFVRIIALVGIPGKALMAGFVFFAAPLLLADAGFGQDDIGLVLVAYSAGVLVANSLLPRLGRSVRQMTRALGFGAVLSGIGLALFAALDGDADTWLRLEGAAVAGLAVLGLAHGLLQGLALAYVAETAAGRRFGAAQVTAAYRFVERAGHIAGPMLVSAALSLGGAAVLAPIGALVALLGVLFFVTRGARA